MAAQHKEPRASDPTDEELLEMFRKMLLVRAFEEKVAYFFSRGQIHGTTHLSIGQEATAVGATGALGPEDLITSTHRGHGHCIGKGIDINLMMSELLGKENGYCRGKGGSMHIADVSQGNLGANGIVGGGIPIATGAGLTTKLKKIDRVVLCFFGDGALNQGVFHESVNLASVWKLPVIYLCENNTYGMSYHISKAVNLEDPADRAKGYGIPGRSVDGNDILAVYEAVREAREYVRESGPMLLVCNTYRYKGHSKSDANRYRSKEEIEAWMRKDPIPRLRTVLTERKLAAEDALDRIEKEAYQTIEDAVAFAEESPEPSVDTILDDVYA